MEADAVNAYLGDSLMGDDPLIGPLYTRELPSLAHNIYKHTFTNTLLISIATR